MKIGVFGLFLSFLVFGCSEKKDNLQIPDYVIPPDKMIDVLVDMHIADGALATLAAENKDSIYKPANFYNQVYKKHNVTKHDVDTSIFFYAQNAKYYDKMYDTVLARISKLIGDVSQTAGNKTDTASINLNN